MTPNAFVFNKEKYLHTMESEGISSALTQLHHDIIRWENEAFEGREGFQPKMWESLHLVRDFSRKLWRISLMTEENKDAIKSAVQAERATLTTQMNSPSD